MVWGLMKCVRGSVCLQNRELQIMKQLKHSNVVELKCSFYSKGEKVCVSLSSSLSGLCVCSQCEPSRSLREPSRSLRAAGYSWQPH